jgi:FAD/FMN-containing dehydrogenase
LGVLVSAGAATCSQLAYSYLPKNKNNKASSLTNLFRNQGGSFGIAFVTTVLARRAQYHQSVLVAHVTSFDRTFSENVQNIANRFIDHATATFPSGRFISPPNVKTATRSQDPKHRGRQSVVVV